MADYLHFFSSYAYLIYPLLGMGLIFVIRILVRARRELGESLYGLERQAATRHMNQAIATLSMIILFAFAELVLTVFLAPNLPASSVVITPTMNPLFTQQSTIPPGLLTNLGITTQVSTSLEQSSGCILGQINITTPKPGDVIKGQVIIIGTANIPNFGFYKYEFAPLGSDIWATIQANREVKIDNELGLWDTSEITPGDYNLRLVVLNNHNKVFQPCLVPVRVVAP
jgi:hypothetical protein